MVETGTEISGLSDERVLDYALVESPLGDILIAGDEAGLRVVNFQRGSDPLPVLPGWRRAGRSLDEAKRQLSAYFRGELRSFELAIAPVGTPFQLEVWTALRSIPYGETVSYGEIAARIGRERAVRAVGAANGRNPIPIVIPCHRVIGSSGKLSGYHGGVWIKERLLAVERQDLFAYEGISR